jgi:class 3 adenylate cyclase
MAITAYDGYIARYMGDGMLVYFGYPQAHEDDAERAVRSGLGILESIPDLNEQVVAQYGVEVAVRVGVATGPVVVGDIIGTGAAEEAAVVGETPNLAARLEGVAQPNQLVISPGTYRLVAPLFEFADLGDHDLKGLPEPAP